MRLLSACLSNLSPGLFKMAPARVHPQTPPSATPFPGRGSTRKAGAPLKMAFRDGATPAQAFWGSGRSLRTEGLITLFLDTVLSVDGP